MQHVARCQNMFGCLENFDNLNSFYRGEVAQEVVDRIAALNVIKEILDRNPCSPKYRHPTQNGRRRLNDVGVHTWTVHMQEI